MLNLREIILEVKVAASEPKAFPGYLKLKAASRAFNDLFVFRRSQRRLSSQGFK